MPTRLGRHVVTVLAAVVVCVTPVVVRPSTAAPDPAGQGRSEQGQQQSQQQNRQQITDYLNQSREFLSRGQYDEAERALMRALVLIEQQRQAALTLASGVEPRGAEPLRVGGTVHPPRKIVDVAPVYPAVALQAKVQGVVILQLVLDPQGNVSSAKVLRSIALLDQAALDAVYQWKFTPTLLNGRPVSVVMTVTVNFKLPGLSR